MSLFSPVEGCQQCSCHSPQKKRRTCAWHRPIDSWRLCRKCQICVCMWGSLDLPSYPFTLTTYKYLHTINGHALGGVRACACVLRCADSVKVVCTIESMTDFLILVIHIKEHQRNTCLHCSWLARSPLKLYDLLPYIRTEICVGTSGSLFALLVPRLLTTNTVHNFMAGMLLCSQQIQQQAFQCSRHMSFQSPFLL